MKNLLYLKLNFTKDNINVEDCIFFKRVENPKSYFHESNNTLSFGYITTNGLEYLNIKVDFIKRKVVIERDYKSSLIIYCFFNGKTLLLSDSFLDMREFCSRSSLDQGILESSIFGEDTSSNTIFKNVKILFPERKYTFSYQSSQCELLSFTPSIANFTLDKLPLYYESEYGKQNIAYEVSGGKDSSLFPIITSLYHKFKDSDFMYGLKFTGLDGITQMRKIQHLSHTLNLPYDYMDLDSEVYVLNQYNSINTFMEYNFDLYKSAITKLKQILVNHNTTISFNGIGGDESFLRKYNIGESTGNIGDKVFDKSFQSRVVKSVYSLENSTMFSPSVYCAIKMCNNSFIRDGIWRVSPFQDIHTLNYLQDLKTSKKDFFKSFYEIFEDEKYSETFQKNENIQDFFRLSVNNSKFNEEIMIMCQSFEFKNYFDIKKVEEVLVDKKSPEAEISKFRLICAFHFYKMLQILFE